MSLLPPGLRGFPDAPPTDGRHDQPIATFIVRHSHEPTECRTAFAAWRGFESPLRHRPTLGSCSSGGHQIWWSVEAADPRGALAQLPDYLAARSTAVEVSELSIP